MDMTSLNRTSLNRMSLIRISAQPLEVVVDKNVSSQSNIHLVGQVVKASASSLADVGSFPAFDVNLFSCGSYH